VRKRERDVAPVGVADLVAGGRVLANSLPPSAGYETA
jgi:hypothetical protein